MLLTKHRRTAEQSSWEVICYEVLRLSKACFHSDLCSSPQLVPLPGAAMESTTRGRQRDNNYRQGENTVPLTAVHLLPSRIVSLLSIFRSLHHIARLLLPLAWLQTLHRRNHICFPWSLISLLHCCKLLEWGNRRIPSSLGVWGFTPSFSKISFNTQARRMQIPQDRVSSFPQRAN